MSLNSTKARLAGLTREVELRWDETRQFWKDSKGDEFEHRFMAELSAEVASAVAAIENLDKLISKARSDCE